MIYCSLHANDAVQLCCTASSWGPPHNPRKCNNLDHQNLLSSSPLKTMPKRTCFRNHRWINDRSLPHLSRSIDDIVLVEDCNGRALSGHVGALGHHLHPSLHQGLSIVLADLVLGGARQGDVILGVCTPRLLALHILACTQGSGSQTVNSRVDANSGKS